MGLHGRLPYFYKRKKGTKCPQKFRARSLLRTCGRPCGLCWLVCFLFLSVAPARVCVCVHSDTKLRVLAGHVFCAVFEATAGASYAMVGEASVATGVYLLDERTPHLTSSLYIVSVLSEIPLQI